MTRRPNTFSSTFICLGSPGPELVTDPVRIEYTELSSRGTHSRTPTEKTSSVQCERAFGSRMISHGRNACVRGGRTGVNPRTGRASVIRRGRRMRVTSCRTTQKHRRAARFVTVGHPAHRGRRRRAEALLLSKTVLKRGVFTAARVPSTAVAFVTDGTPRRLLPREIIIRIVWCNTPSATIVNQSTNTVFSLLLSRERNKRSCPARLKYLRGYDEVSVPIKRGETRMLRRNVITGRIQTTRRWHRSGSSRSNRTAVARPGHVCPDRVSLRGANLLRCRIKNPFRGWKQWVHTLSTHYFSIRFYYLRNKYLSITTQICHWR